MMMKKTFSIAILVFVIIFAGCNQPSGNAKHHDPHQVFNLDTTQLKTGDVYYQCPMDTEVISDEEGQCPKCEMDLHKKIKK